MSIGRKTTNFSAPGRTRTCGQLIRSQLLYPLSYGRLWGRISMPPLSLSVIIIASRVQHVKHNKTRGCMIDSAGKLVSQAQMGMTFILKASIDGEFSSRVILTLKTRQKGLRCYNDQNCLWIRMQAKEARSRIRDTDICSTSWRNAHNNLPSGKYLLILVR